MTGSLRSQMEALRTSIQGLEAQRGTLADEIIQPALEALQEQLAVLEQQETARAFPTEERRMVSILFIDMVGSTAMAEKLDPEEWRQVVAQLHSTLGEAITAHHGLVAQYLGDGLLAFFGSKEASEHDPENAIRAALDAQAAVADLRSVPQVQLRAGIHTGLVVVGELGDETHKEFTASGDAMNLAARLQSAAPPGGTLISHETYRYVRGVFDLTPYPPLKVKGKSEPLRVYLVRRAKTHPFRSVRRGVAGVETRTIGREQVMKALQDAYLRAYEQHSLVWAQLVSEPGVGKSRLLADMSEWIDLREETARLLRARAFPDDASQPFALVRRMWFDRFQIAEDVSLEQAESKWVARFKDFSDQEEWEEPAHALGLLVGLPFEHSPHIKGMRNDPAQVKGRALVVSRELLQAVRQQYPVVILLEDLQWADLASWEYLKEVFLDGSEGESLQGLFILGAARPEWHPPQELGALLENALSAEAGAEQWGLQISLEPLADQSVAELAKEILQRVEHVPQQVIDLLVERSEGVPFFTEEIVNWFIDHGILDTHTEPWCFLPDRLKEQPLPATLQHLLLSRLSDLSYVERAALQCGAIFGRRFWTGGVEALGGSAPADTLGHLQPRGFVQAQPESAFQGDTEWSFHHNLLQEVTYESVLKRERAKLHRVAAGWLEGQARQAGRLDEFAGLLGDHCERAGELSAAADWYLQAGRSAFKQGAPRQAKGFFTQALDLLPPVDRERRWQALLGREEAHAALGDAEPWKADVTALVELARSFEDETCLAEACFRLAVFAGRTTDHSIRDQASREALSAARRCGNEALEAKALILVAVSAIGRGEKEIGLQAVEQSLEIARRHGDERVLAFVLARASICYGAYGELAHAYPLFVEQLELYRRLGDRMGEAGVLANGGAGYRGNGMYKQARELLGQSYQIHKTLGVRRGLAYNLMNLAELELATGDLRKARQFAQQALQEIIPTQDVFGRSFSIHLEGYVLLALGDPGAAARRFSEARQLALGHQLPGVASESTIGLAVCATQQGQLDEARTCVTEGWKYLQEHGWEDLNGSLRAYLSCIETFDALGDTDNAWAVIQAGHQALMELADKKNIPIFRQSFLENVPENRAIMERWERGRSG